MAKDRKNEVSDRRRRNLRGALLGTGLLTGAAMVTLLRNCEEKNTSPSVLKSPGRSAREDPSLPDPSRRYTDDLRQLRSEPLPQTLAAPRQFGLLVKSDVKTLAQYRLALQYNGQDYTLNAIPQIDPGATSDSIDNERINADPLNALKATASDRQKKIILEAMRGALRGSGFTWNWDADQPVTREDSDFEPVRLTYSHRLQNDKMGEKVLTPVLDQDTLFLDIDLGETTSGEYQWFKKFIDTPSQLTAKINKEIESLGPAAKFFKEAVTNPETGAVDFDALDTLERVFALPKDQRQAFADALNDPDQSRGMSKAKEILFFYTDPSVKELFNALVAYVEKAKEEGLTFPNTREDTSDFMEKLFEEGGLPEKQIDRFSSLPVYVTDFLCKYINDPTKEQTHEASVSAFSEYVMNSENRASDSANLSSYRANFPSYMSEQILEAIKQRPNEVLGLQGNSAWLDSLGEDNIPGLLYLFGKQACLETRDPNTEFLNNCLYTGKDGHAHLICVIPRGGISTPYADETFQRISDFAHAMYTNAVPWGQDENRSLRENLLEYFASDLNPATTQPPSPAEFLRLLSDIQPPEPDVKNTLANPKKHGNITFGEPSTFNGITWQPMQEMEPAQQRKTPGSRGR